MAVTTRKRQEKKEVAAEPDYLSPPRGSDVYSRFRERHW